MAKSKKKKKALPPRRKRINRAARLRSAKKWLASFKGEKIVRGYARWFGVDLLCAVKELQLLGVELDATYLEGLHATLHYRRRKKPKTTADGPGGFGQSDEHFSFIIGYTSGGMPYGMPWSDDEIES